MTKPPLLVLLHDDYVARDLLDGRTIERLAEEFELAFVVTDRITVDLASYGSIASTYRMEWSSWRMQLWVYAFSFRHLAGLDPVIRTQPGRLEGFLRGRGDRLRRRVFRLHRLGLSPLLARTMRSALKATARDVVELPDRPVAALLPTGINDPVWDDLVLQCRRQGIPSLTLVVNWDNIAHKIFLQEPDWLGVWGEQGYLFSRLLQRFPAERTLTLGAPRFDAYEGLRTAKADARRRLGWPLDQRRILFAGAGASFDEVSVLYELEDAIASGRLPDDLHIVYKPHPRRQERIAEPPLEPERLRFTTIVDPTGYTPLADYATLFSAVDAVISPLSTMMLEATLAGLPFLGLAYDDPAHANFPWQVGRLANHLHVVLNGPWHVPCTERRAVLAGVDRLLDLIGDMGIAAQAKAAAGFIVWTDERRYADRVVDALWGIIEQDADHDRKNEGIPRGARL